MGIKITDMPTSDPSIFGMLWNNAGAMKISLTHLISYAANIGGSIVGTNPQSVADGGDGTEVTATPGGGRAFLNWSDAVATAARTDLHIHAPFSATASFWMQQLVPAATSTYVKATSSLGSFDCPNCADNTKSVGGNSTNNSWLATGYTQQRLHYDLGAAYVVKGFKYYPYHHNAGETSRAAKNFTLWGSNDAAAFADTTYSTDTNWNLITTDINQLVQYDAAWHQVLATNATAYRYYALKIADNWGQADYLGFRQLHFWIEPTS